MSTYQNRAEAKNKNRPELYLVNEEETTIKRNRSKKRKLPKYAKMLLAVLFSYVAISFVIGGYEVWQMDSKINLLKKEYEQLSKEQQMLKGEIEELNNPEVIEKIARESLGMVKPGEIVVVQAVPEENIPKPKSVSNKELAD